MWVYKCEFKSKPFFHNPLTLSAVYVGLGCLNIWSIYVVLKPCHCMINIYLPDHFWSMFVHMTCSVLWVKDDLSSLLYRHQNRTGLLCTPDWLHDQTGRTLFKNPTVSLVRVCVWYAVRVNVCMCARAPWWVWGLHTLLACLRARGSLVV